MLKDLHELHACVAMSLPQLQLAFIHLPENDNDQSKFMVGLECKMVCVDKPCHDVKAEGHPRTKFTYSTELHVNARFQWQCIWGWLCAPALFNHFTSQTEIWLLLLSSQKSSFPPIHHHLKSTTISLKISGGQFWLKQHFLLLQYAHSNRKRMLTAQQ